MEYNIYHLKENLGNLEHFLLEVAANEELIRHKGLGRALRFESSELGLKCLESIQEDFTLIKRSVLRVDQSLGLDLEKLDADTNLIERLCRIALRFKMLAAVSPLSAKRPFILQMLNRFGLLYRRDQFRDLFTEIECTPQQLLLAVGRLKSVLAVCWDIQSARTSSDNPIFKPSSVNPERVADLIDTALSELSVIDTISPTIRARLEGYLNEAKNEALSTHPAWSRIVGALVIVATLTSGLAEIPGAVKAVNDAINYILGTSVDHPLQKLGPTNNERFDSGPASNMLTQQSD